MSNKNLALSFIANNKRYQIRLGPDIKNRRGLYDLSNLYELTILSLTDGGTTIIEGTFDELVYHAAVHHRYVKK